VSIPRFLPQWHSSDLDKRALGPSIYIAAIPLIKEEFEVTMTKAIAPASLYAYGLTIGVLVGTAACEVFGRTIVYRVSIPLSFIFTVVGGSARNYATIAIARMLSGLFAGPSVAVGVGVINDMWDLSLEKTGTMFAVIYAFMNVWPAQIGPMASAALIEHHTWRWVFWCPAILIGIASVAAFLIPETYMPKIERKLAKRDGVFVGTDRNSLDLFLISVGRPLHMILVEPVCPYSIIVVVMEIPEPDVLIRCEAHPSNWSCFGDYSVSRLRLLCSLLDDV
jgi:MFS family permease